MCEWLATGPGIKTQVLSIKKIISRAFNHDRFDGSYRSVRPGPVRTAMPAGLYETSPSLWAGADIQAPGASPPAESGACPTSPGESCSGGRPFEDLKAGTAWEHTKPLR